MNALDSLGLSSHISNLTHLQTLNFTNNHLEVYSNDHQSSFFCTAFCFLGITDFNHFAFSFTNSQTWS